MFILYFFEKLRNPICDYLMMGITMFGDEVVFLLLSLIVYWCIDKNKGYFLMSVGFLGTAVNQLLKISFHVPRPWVKDPNFTIVEMARESAGDYSFPSGHSQSSVGLFGGLAMLEKNRKLRILCIVIAVLTPISRLYLGVHTFQDVTVAACMALLLAWLLKPVSEGKHLWIVSTLVPVACLGYLAYAVFFPFADAVEPEFLFSARKNGAELLGAALGVSISYYLDRKYLNFSVKAPLKVQICKVILGFAVILTLRVVLKAVLEPVFLGHWSRKIVENGLVVLTAGFVWPWVFTAYLSKKGETQS